jgi:hypothetical protein
VIEEPAISKLFEEKRNQMVRATKNVTIDMDLNIIPVQELKGLGPALIVPKVTGGKGRKVSEPAAQPGRRPPKAVPEKPKAVPKKKAALAYLEPDLPIFEENPGEASVAERIVCVPGVTLRDGALVKTRSRRVNPDAITFAQYEEYRRQVDADAGN